MPPHQTAPMEKCTSPLSSNSRSLVTFLLLFILSPPVSSHQVKAIFQFGDSILDAGNNNFIPNCTIHANFHPYGQDFFHRPTGRFTNGRTVGDFVSEFLGIPLQRPFLEVELLLRKGRLKEYPSNGINFASAGSGILNETNNSSGVVPIERQLQQFETLVQRNNFSRETVEKSLFLFEAGSNDIFHYFTSRVPPKPDPDDLVETMVSIMERVVRRCYELGARRIAMLGLGPVGCVPARVAFPGARPEDCIEEINDVVEKLNRGLEGLVMEIPSKLAGAFGVYGATYELVQLFRHSTKIHGFTNATGACCGAGMLRGAGQCGVAEYEVCNNPYEYLFWDYFHPSERACKLISKAFWGGGSLRVRPVNLKRLVNLPNA